MATQVTPCCCLLLASKGLLASSETACWWKEVSGSVSRYWRYSGSCSVEWNKLA